MMMGVGKHTYGGSIGEPIETGYTDDLSRRRRTGDHQTLQNAVRRSGLYRA